MRNIKAPAQIRNARSTISVLARRTGPARYTNTHRQAHARITSRKENGRMIFLLTNCKEIQ